VLLCPVPHASLTHLLLRTLLIGELLAIPVYPSTWLSARIHKTGEVVKLRSTNMEVKDEGGPNRTAMYNL
jgi:hypothetical protein